MNEDDAKFEKMMNDMKNHSPLDVNKYVLKDNEKVVGEEIVCKTCGTVRRVKKWSPLTSCYIWASKAKDGDEYLCECDKRRTLQKALDTERDNFRKLYDCKAFRDFLGERYINLGFKNLPENNREDYMRARKACWQYVMNINNVLQKGLGMYIWSPTAGNGKTSLMACVRNNLVAKGIRCIMINLTELLKYAKGKNIESDATEPFSYRLFKTVDVLILDDIGVNDLRVQNNYTQWAQTELYELMEARNKNNKCTLFTSNYSPKELQEVRGYDFKTVDRIVERSTVMIKIEGESFRGKEVQIRNEENTNEQH